MTVQWPFSGLEGGGDIRGGKCRPGKKLRAVPRPIWVTGRVLCAEGGPGPRGGSIQMGKKKLHERRQGVSKAIVDPLRRGRPERFLC